MNTTLKKKNRQIEGSFAVLSKNVNQLSRFFVFGYLIQIHNLLGHTVGVAFFAHVKIAKSEFWVEFLLCFIARMYFDFSPEISTRGRSELHPGGEFFSIPLFWGVSSWPSWALDRFAKYWASLESEIWPWPKLFLLPFFQGSDTATDIKFHFVLKK